MDKFGGKMSKRFKEIPTIYINKMQVVRDLCFRGVSIERRRKNNCPWRADLHMKGKRIFLGYFQTFNEAKKARLEAEMQNGFKNGILY